MVRPLLPVLLLMIAGCKEPALIELQDAQNYHFVSTISAKSITVAAGTDQTVEWSTLTHDLLGNPIDAAVDVATVGLVRFNGLTEEEVRQGINDETLAQSDLAGFAEFAVVEGRTSASFSEFALFGTSVDPAADIVAGSTYLASVVDHDAAYQMFVFFAPVEDAPEATVSIASDSAWLEYEVDLEASDPVALPGGGQRVRIDWTRLTENGADREIDLSDIDRMTLARYDESPAELEGDFLQVEALAERTWMADVEGYGDWYLDELEATDDGSAFEGFDGEGTWLLALLCSTCINPAPPFLATVQPE